MGNNIQPVLPQVPRIMQYYATLYQEDTQAPVSVESLNTMDDSIVWTRLSTGTYRATRAAGVNVNTICHVTNSYLIGGACSFQMGRSGTTHWTLHTRNAAGALSDDILFNASVTILMFN